MESKYWLVKGLAALPEDKSQLEYAAKTKDGDTYLMFIDKRTRKNRVMKYCGLTTKDLVCKSSEKEFVDVQDFVTVLHGLFHTKSTKISDTKIHNRAKRIRLAIDQVLDMSEDEFFEDCLADGKEDNLLDYKTIINLKRIKQQVDIRKAMIQDALKIKWKPWQQRIIDIISQKPDSRAVYVVLDPKGGVGKSFFSRNYGLLHKSKVLEMSPGRKQDMLYVASQKVGYDTVLIDMCRGDFKEEISYSAIECLKNGRFISTKYESKQIYGGPVHIVIFTNKPLDYKQLSEDRWHILFINRDESVLEFTPKEKPMDLELSDEEMYSVVNT